VNDDILGLALGGTAPLELAEKDLIGNGFPALHSFGIGSVDVTPSFWNDRISTILLPVSNQKRDVPWSFPGFFEVPT
jgi:hypothetical protein